MPVPNHPPQSSTTNWLASIRDHPALLAVSSRLSARRETWLRVGGGTGSSGIISVGCLALLQKHSAPSSQDPRRPFLLLVAHLDEADEAVDELRALSLDARRFPALEVLPGETGVSPDLLGERLALAHDLAHPRAVIPDVIIAPIPALMQGIPPASQLDRWCLTLSVGDQKSPGAVMSWLDAAGYCRVPVVESPGEFAVRGGVLDVFPAGGRDDSPPVRLDFDGDRIDALAEVDPDTMASDRRLHEVRLVGAAVNSLLGDDDFVGLWDFLPPDTILALQEILDITEQGRGYFERASASAGLFGLPAVLKSLTVDRSFAVLHLDHHSPAATDPDATFDFPFSPLPSFSESAPDAVVELDELAHADDPADARVIVLCDNDAERTRFDELLAEAVRTGRAHQGRHIESLVSYLHRGFTWSPDPASRLSLIPYHELLHRYQTRRRIRRLKAGRAMDTFLDLAPGDFVVHRDHGIARFVGLRHMQPRQAGAQRSESPGIGSSESPASTEYLTLEFAAKTLLHVPASKIDLIQRYVGGFHGRPPISTLGGRKWSRQKDQVTEAVRDLAAEMLRLQAARASQPGIRFPPDTPWQSQFEAEFPYEETEDQIAAVAQIKQDMLDDRPMDRLLCGDVGFGKTELAIRAAFKTVEYGKQVAVLVPTTVLAEQHGRTFRQRFADYPFRVAVLSRFQSAAETRAILDSLKRGRIDIAIGTHRLLSADVKFADLGLVVIDEEQRFGVEHKQRLLKFRLTADVLTLSATPIPRTLHMSLLGLRDISSLTTPPLDRRAIVTEVAPFNDRRIKNAVDRELAREGQVYFVHNRVHNIRSIADDIQRLAPSARIVVGHGQMPDGELEDVMLKFIRHEADILVSTTIIESGIDIPNANTMFINEADRFGLADLHQLRGRVGRSRHRAYCYMLLSQDRSVTEVAARRLKAVEEFSMLGAGFRIAMRDLEIRGAGNLLGPEQSGHIAAVGYEMYCHLLENAVHDLKNERPVVPIDTDVEIDAVGAIPRTYIPSEARRLEAYRRISQPRNVEELAHVSAELADAYGELPPSTRLLIDLSEIRIRAAHLGVRSITRHESDVIFRTREPAAVAAVLQGAKGSVRILEPREQGGYHEVYFRPPASYLQPTTLVALLRKRLATPINPALASTTTH